MAHKFFEIVGFSEIVMFCREIFGLLLLVKIKVFEFCRKSLKKAPSLL